jgi:hypothetical protein
MAKIVNPPEPKRVKCNACGATIEYLPEEVVVRVWSDYDGCGNREEYIKCPRVGEAMPCPGKGVIRTT